MIVRGAYHGAFGGKKGNRFLDVNAGCLWAFSLEKINSRLSGTAIQIRRTNNNDVASFPFVGDSLPIADILAFCGGASGKVSYLVDQSGFGAHVLQNVNLSQPSLVINGVLQERNGKPALYFNAANNEFMVTQSNVSISSSYSIHAVAASDGGTFRSICDVNLNDRVIEFNNTGLITRANSNTTIVNQFTGGYIVANQQYLVTTFSDGINHTQMTNNVVRDTRAFVVNPTVGTLKIAIRGANPNGLTGWIQELSIFNTHLNIATRNDQINSRYGAY